MELPLEVVGIISHFDETEHIETVFQESAWFSPFGAGIKILSREKDDPDKLSVDQRQGEGEEKKD
jgi:hypothetical protein